MQDLKTGLFLADNDQTRRVLPQTSADIVEILSSAGEASNVQAEISSLRTAKISAPAVGGSAGQVLSLDESGNTVWKADEKGDTLPSVSSATAGQVLKVNSAVNGTEWGDVPKELPEQLGTSGQVLAVNSTANGVEWKTPESGLPAIGSAGQVLAVNSDATGAEWKTPESGLPAISSASAGDLLAVNSTANGVEWKKNIIIKKSEANLQVSNNTTPIQITNGSANRWYVQMSESQIVIPNIEKVIAIHAFSIQKQSNSSDRTKKTREAAIEQKFINGIGNEKAINVYFEEQTAPTDVINIHVAIYYTD